MGQSEEGRQGEAVVVGIFEKARCSVIGGSRLCCVCGGHGGFGAGYRGAEKLNIKGEFLAFGAWQCRQKE
jgi:hypothetical protein